VDSTPEPRSKRGGCAETFVLLHVVGSVAVALYLVGTEPSAVAFLIGGVIVGLCILLAWGFYARRQWARFVLVFLATMSTMSALAALYEDVLMIGELGIDPSHAILVLPLATIPLFLYGYVVYWFVTHGEYFRQDSGR